MGAILKSIKNYWRFWLTLIIGAVSLGFSVAQRSLDNPYSEYIIIVWSILVSVFLASGMIRDLRAGHYGVDILALTAIVACLAVGQFWAALVIVLMLTGGEALEDYAAGRAEKELSELLKRSPKIAHLASGNDIAVSKIKSGDVLVVRPREVVPVDSELISRVAEFDESSLTGESLPATRHQGERIMSGALNGDTAVEMRALATAKNSQYEKIIALVREGQQNPAPFVRLADRYAVPFTLVSYLIAGLAWYFSGSATRFAEVLVVASPCPLILAAPIALISGMSLSSRHGIIVKSGATLEKFADARAIAFDKTGTLTRNLIEVSAITPADGFTAARLIEFAAAAENNSSHVLARSLMRFARAKKPRVLSAENVREIVGSGIYATVNREKILVGKLSFMVRNKIANLPKESDEITIFVAVGGKFAGRIVFEDKLRKNSATTVADLRRLGFKEIVMLTGDNDRTAAKISRKLNIGFRAKLAPAGKVREVKKLRRKFGLVAMVGDGVNDAPVLATADVGLAMVSRNETAASQSADVVILADDISRVATFRQISRQTMRIAKQSVWSGILLCLVLMIVAAGGFIPAIIGAALQELVDISVIFNALRAHKDRDLHAKL